MKLKRAALAVGLSSLLAGLAFPALAQDAGWDSVVAAAKKEGKVVVYSMALGAPYYLAVLKSFEAKYGIKVESLDLRASELAERVRTEQAAGRFLGDAEIITTTMIEEQRKAGDYIQAVGRFPNVEEFATPRSRPPRSAFPPTCSRWESWSIRGWSSRRTNRRAGRISTIRNGRARSSPTTCVRSAAAIPCSPSCRKSWAPAFNEKLAEQKPVFSRDLRNDARRVARGEYPIYVPQIFAFASDLKGLPVKVVIPKEGAPYAMMEFAMLKNAAASQRGAAAHRPLPRAGFAAALRQWLDAAGGRRRRRPRQ